MQLGSIKGVLSNLGTRYGYALDTFQEWRGVEPLTRRSSDFHRSLSGAACTSGKRQKLIYVDQKELGLKGQFNVTHLAV